MYVSRLAVWWMLGCVDTERIDIGKNYRREYSGGLLSIWHSANLQKERLEASKEGMKHGTLRQHLIMFRNTCQ